MYKVQNPRSNKYPYITHPLFDLCLTSEQPYRRVHGNRVDAGPGTPRDPRKGLSPRLTGEGALGRGLHGDRLARPE